MYSKLVITLAGWLIAATAHAQILEFSPAPEHVVCAAIPDGHRGPFFKLEIKRTGDPKHEFWRTSKTPVEVSFHGFAEDVVIETEWVTSTFSTRCAEEQRQFVALPGIGSLKALQFFHDGCGFGRDQELHLHMDSPTGISPRLYLLKCESVNENMNE